MARKGSIMSWCPKTPTARVLCLMLVAVLGIYLYRKIGMMREGMEGNCYKPEGGSKMLVYFHMNGCGHCKNFDPEWSKFESANRESGSVVGNCKIEASSGHEGLKKCKVKGFPTVMLTDHEFNPLKEYSGERKSDGLTAFVMSNH